MILRTRLKKEMVVLENPPIDSKDSCDEDSCRFRRPKERNMDLHSGLLG